MQATVERFNSIHIKYLTISGLQKMKITGDNDKNL